MTDGPFYFLGISTIYPDICISIARDDEILYSQRISQAHESLESLPQLLQSACKRVDVSLSSFTAAAVIQGPGAYTGIRVGISVLRTLSQLYGFPVYGLNALDALAWERRGINGISWVIRQARRHDYHLACIGTKEGKLHRMTDDLCLPLDHLLTILKSCEYTPQILSDLPERFERELRHSVPDIHYQALNPSADPILSYARTQYRSGVEGAWKDLRPQYSHPAVSEG